MPLFRYVQAQPNDSKIHIRDIWFNYLDTESVPAITTLCGIAFDASTTGVGNTVPVSNKPLCEDCNGIARPE